MSDVKFNLKVMMNKQKTKVLFAEAGGDFADVLLSFLTLPLGAIVRAMNNHYGGNAPTLGSLTTLYKGVSNLDSMLFRSEGAKEMLLNPRSWFNDYYRTLKLSVSEPQPDRYFICENSCVLSDLRNVGIYYGTGICRCGKILSFPINFPHCWEWEKSYSTRFSDGVLSAETASFIICDDMKIAPNVMGSVMETYSVLGVKDTEDAELSNVTLGLNEIMDLLKGMLMSSTPLTDVILKITQMETLRVGLGKIMKVDASKSKKMILKVMVQKSKNKLLFAQAEENFVDFILGLLTIPLGGVESLLGNNTCLKSIDNFYTSLSCSNVGKYLKNEDMKTMLLNPKLPYGYLDQDQILPLTEDVVPSVYVNPKIYNLKSRFSRIGKPGWSSAVPSMKSPRGDLYYVKGPRMYMVTDDLTVTPLCMSSSISHINRLNIPMSDVAELEFDIGLEEALSILKASLTSTCALTNGLLLLKKRVKQEQ